jgi:hypothetical protein
MCRVESLVLARGLPYREVTFSSGQGKKAPEVLEQQRQLSARESSLTGNLTQPFPWRMTTMRLSVRQAESGEFDPLKLIFVGPQMPDLFEPCWGFQI